MTDDELRKAIDARIAANTWRMIAAVLVGIALVALRECCCS